MVVVWRFRDNLVEPGLEIHFQQVNEHEHTAKVTMECFRSKDIYVFESPTHTPNLHAIEYMWLDQTEYEQRWNRETSNIAVTRCKLSKMF